MVKTSSLDNNGVKKGAWSEEEDHKLRSYIQRYGHWNWGLLPKFAGLSRSGKSCRLRWMNYLRPNIRRGNFTKEEDDKIIYLHNKHGNKWSLIATELRGRSDNEIKNRWNTHLKKRAQDDQMVVEPDHHGAMQPADQASQKENPEPQLQNEDFWTEAFLEDITSSVDSMFAPLNVADDSVAQAASYEDMTMNDGFSWSMLGSYDEYNNDFITCWDCI